jgi:Skp family chaperone for outer membrane proteins
MLFRRLSLQGWLACLGLVFLCAVPLAAQENQSLRSPILSLDQERLFARSEFGQRIAAELQANSLVLEAENRRIESALEAEEKDLTVRRPAMSPEAFRALADAFDTKVQRIRTEQVAKARDLVQRNEEEQRQFLDTARPVLEQLMLDTGAVAIIDPRSVVMSLSVIDVTEEARRRIDAIIGDGSRRNMPVAPPEAPTPAPEPPADEPPADSD